MECEVTGLKLLASYQFVVLVSVADCHIYCGQFAPQELLKRCSVSSRLLDQELASGLDIFADYFETGGGKPHAY